MDTQILQEFLELTAYTVPSGHEREIRECLRKKLTNLHFTVWEDAAFPECNSGNLYGRLEGDKPGPATLFACHMDTVTPCEHKKIRVEPDGVIHTDGSTILGGDDITGIVELLSALRRLQLDHLPHRTIEVVFTASEEYFVEGARRLNYSTITAPTAYVLDTDGPIGRAIVAAPTGIRLLASITGRAAHAALKPEDGVNAIQIAAEAVSHMCLGRIDENTTANIGMIQGGSSGNIVPDHCNIEGETRSLHHESALRQKDHMEQCLRDAANRFKGKVQIESNVVYNAWSVPISSEICTRFSTAVQLAGLIPQFEQACGGSDASFLSAHGIQCLVVATGMHEIHSVREYTTLAEMEQMADVIFYLLCDASGKRVSI